MTTATPPVIRDLLAWRPDELPRVHALLALRRWWMTDLYARLRAEWNAADGPETVPAVLPGDDQLVPTADAAAAMERAAPIVGTLPTLPMFNWVDRYVQDRLWREVATMVDERNTELVAAMATYPDDRGTLTADPDLELPHYYESFDFHRQDGGIWRDLRGAAIYAMGARVIHVGRNDANELHDQFATDIPLDEAPTSIVDVACGFGKTTLSLARRWRAASVTAVDLSMPCLRLGRRLATEEGLDIDWRQGAAERLPVDDASADLVTITMALHELPTTAIAMALAEARRVLRPGGMLVALENRLIGDPLRDVLGAWHSDIIGEPFMNPFRRSEPAEAAAEHGFDATMRPWYPPGAQPGGELDPARWSSPWRLLVAVSPVLATVGSRS